MSGLDTLNHPHQLVNICSHVSGYRRPGHVPAVTLEFTETSECVVNRSVLSEAGTAVISY